METISAVELNAILNDLTDEPKSIRAFSHSVYIGQYPGDDPLSRRIIEKSGIYSMVLWCAPREINKYQILKSRAALTSPLEDIHFMRYLRLSPHASSVEVHDVDASEKFIATFKLNEGALHFMDHKERERHCAIENIAYVEVDFDERRLTFH